jgi:hypothetical protein
MTLPANRLFSGTSLRDFIIYFDGKIEAEIDKICLVNPNISDDDLIESITVSFTLQLPKLNTEEVHISGESNSKVDVRLDQSRSVSDRSKPYMVDGKRLIVTVPYIGDPRLLLQNPKAPNAISANLVTVERGSLDLIYERALPLDHDLLERDIKNDIQAIEAALTFVHSLIAPFNNTLKENVSKRLVARKRVLQEGSNALAGMKLPVRLKEPAKKLPLTSSVKTGQGQPSSDAYQYDVFICHASEDKEDVAEPLAKTLLSKNVRVWYDAFSLELGDSLRSKIDQGLKESRYGIVILSPHFFEKHWPQYELDGLVTREMRGVKVVLPIWHKVGSKEVEQYSPSLAGKVAASTKDMTQLVNQILKVVGKTTTVQTTPIVLNAPEIYNFVPSEPHAAVDRAIIEAIAKANELNRVYEFDCNGLRLVIDKNSDAAELLANYHEFDHQQGIADGRIVSTKLRFPGAPPR